jgi:septation ring formation regulator EzrA
MTMLYLIGALIVVVVIGLAAILVYRKNQARIDVTVDEVQKAAKALEDTNKPK